MSEPEIRVYAIEGLDGIEVRENVPLGHLMVSHDGTITWDQLQIVKNEVWGPSARAIEVFPVEGDVVNTGNYRHLWRLGPGDFAPDLLKHSRAGCYCDDSLELRHERAWREADGVLA